MLLLQAGAVVSIDRLAEQLYGEEPPVTAVTQVHRQVSELRRLLGERAIETRPPGYRIDLQPGQLDLDRFEHLTADAAPALAHGEPARAAGLLREALALWRGDPLADLAFEPFAPPVIARLRELRLAALEQRIEADLAAGSAAELVPELEALAAEEPLRERLQGQRMVALYRCGRQQEALDAYRSLRTALVETFGIEPTPPLQELERRILRQDPALDRPAADPAPAPARAALVVAEDEAGLDVLLRLAGPLAAIAGRELIAVQLVPAVDDVAAAAARLAAWRTTLAGTVRSAAFSTTDAAADIVRLQASHDVDLVLVARRGPVLDVAADELDAVVGRLTADAAVLVNHGAAEAVGRGIAVPFAGGAHDWAALEAAAWLARARGEELWLLGVRGGASGARPDASRLLADASLAIQRLVGVDAAPRLVDADAASLAAATADAAAVLVGLPPNWRTDGLGVVRAGLLARASVPVLLVHRGIRPGALAPPAAATRYSWSAAG